MKRLLTLGILVVPGLMFFGIALLNLRYNFLPFTEPLPSPSGVSYLVCLGISLVLGIPLGLKILHAGNGRVAQELSRLNKKQGRR